MLLHSNKQDYKNHEFASCKAKLSRGGPGIRIVDKSDFNLQNTRINKILPEEGVAHKLDKSMNRVYLVIQFFSKSAII